MRGTEKKNISRNVQCLRHFHNMSKSQLPCECTHRSHFNASVPGG